LNLTVLVVLLFVLNALAIPMVIAFHVPKTTTYNILHQALLHTEHVSVKVLLVLQLYMFNLLKDLELVFNPLTDLVETNMTISLMLSLNAEKMERHIQLIHVQSS
jgi:hypothetical protein